jgi:hypothetical protein
MDLKDQIISEVASAALEKVSRRIITALQRMKGSSLQSGVDSGLTNIWDEVCVQVQTEYSFYWDAYKATIDPIIEDEIQKLPAFVRHAIWFQTDQEFAWLCDAAGKEHPEVPSDSWDGIADHIFEYMLEQARKWSNPRIRAYRERDSRDW